MGLILCTPKASPGYTLMAPETNTTTYLIDNFGRKVHSWQNSRPPAQTAYLLPNGNLLRPTRDKIDWPSFADYKGRRVQILAWDGSLVWDYLYSDGKKYLQHHDVAPLPNGNVLLLAWERKSKEDAIAAGRDPSKIPFPGEIWTNHVVEIQPTGLTTGKVVWKWSIWDHLVQEHDPAKDNYGKVADHPQLLNINSTTANFDFNHANSIHYNAALDQIILSYLSQSELIIIDHSTTTAEAAGHSGGKGGKGGDILYRWGNPVTYGAGDATQQALWGLHDAHWIDPGLPGAGNILVFDNGLFRPQGNFATVVEIKLPISSATGKYDYTKGAPFGPAAPTWTYKSPADLPSQIVSGADRMPNDNTLIASGEWGTLLEVTRGGEIVWKYINPVIETGPLKQGQKILRDKPAAGNMLFKVRRYAPQYPGLVGKDLTPKGTIEG